MASKFTISIIPASELSYTRALNEFFIPNLPFIISGATGEWSCQHDWISSTPVVSDDDGDFAQEDEILEGNHTQDTKDEKTMPNWDYLSLNYGQSKVNVLQCPIEEDSTTTQEGAGEQGEEEEYGAGEMTEMTFNEVVQLWKNGKGKGLYIKDWHLPLQVREESVKSHNAGEGNNDMNEKKYTPPNCSISTTNQVNTSSFPNQTSREERTTTQEGKPKRMFYKTPNIFANDWMNNYYSNNTNDDFTFIYFGTKDTFTPLHRDVYTSYSWSANLLGRKKWYLVPPSSIPNCRVDPSNANSSLHNDIRPGKVNTLKYPSFEKVEVIEVIQEVGMIIFIPSNWFHCVENLDDFVISLNRNWCNSINLFQMFQCMLDSIKETEDALSDVKDVLIRRQKMDKEVDLEIEWNEIVQDVLIKNVGWGWETFYSMIRYNLLHPAAPPSLSPPSTQLKETLSKIFANHSTESKKRTRASSYDGALEVALSIIDS